MLTVLRICIVMIPTASGKYCSFNTTWARSGEVRPVPRDKAVSSAAAVRAGDDVGDDRSTDRVTVRPPVL